MLIIILIGAAIIYSLFFYAAFKMNKENEKEFWENDNRRKK